MSQIAAGDPRLPGLVAAYMAKCERDGACLVAKTSRYGEVAVGSDRLSAHRASYIVHNGPIAAGLVVRHKCDRPQCVEPSHLEAGTPSQNERDKRRSGRSRSVNAGESNRHARVNPEIVCQMRRRARDGESLSSIADDLGLTPSLVRGAVRGATWRTVDAEPPVPQRSHWSRPSPFRRNDEDRRRALLLADNGRTLAEIAAELECSRRLAWVLTQEAS